MVKSKKNCDSCGRLSRVYNSYNSNKSGKFLCYRCYEKENSEWRISLELPKCIKDKENALKLAQIRNSDSFIQRMELFLKKIKGSKKDGSK